MTLVVFDIGGVLVRIRHSWDEVLASLGKAPLQHSEPWRHVDYAPLSSYQDGSMSEDDYLQTLSRDIKLNLGEAIEAHHAILDREYDGIVALVTDLKAVGVKTACLSNTNDLHWKSLTDPSLYPSIGLLDRQFASFEIGVNKPSPEAFETVTDCFPEAQTRVFFDDSASNVAAALELGWDAYRIDPDGDPARQMRTFLQSCGTL